MTCDMTPVRQTGPFGVQEERPASNTELAHRPECLAKPSADHELCVRREERAPAGPCVVYPAR
jgi:hypothetical protein